MKRIILIIVMGLVKVLIFSCKAKVNLKPEEGFIEVQGESKLKISELTGISRNTLKKNTLKYTIDLG